MGLRSHLSVGPRASTALLPLLVLALVLVLALLAILATVGLILSPFLINILTLEALAIRQ